MNDESSIRASLAEWQQAFCPQDVDALMASRAGRRAVRRYPALRGRRGGMRQKIIGCLPYFPDDTHIETRNLSVTVGHQARQRPLPWDHPAAARATPAGRHWFRWLHGVAEAARWPLADPPRPLLRPLQPLHRARRALPTPGRAGCRPKLRQRRQPGELVRDLRGRHGPGQAFYTAVFGFEFTRLEAPSTCGPSRCSRPTPAPAAHWAGRWTASGPAAAATCGSGSTCADCSDRPIWQLEWRQVVKPKVRHRRLKPIAIVKDSEGNLIGLALVPLTPGENHALHRKLPHAARSRRLRGGRRKRCSTATAPSARERARCCGSCRGTR